MKNLIVLITVAIFALINTTSAFADSRTDRKSNTAAVVSSHDKGAAYRMIQIERKAKDRDNCPATFIVLNDYLDGDTQTDIAYSDYLEDLGWWISEYNVTCQVTPEILGS